MTEIDVSISPGPIRPLNIASTFEPAPSGLTVQANVGGGTFAAGAYFWKITGTDSLGETTGSNEASVAVALNGTATLTWNALPTGTTGVKVYRGTVSNSENALIATLGAVLTYTDTGTAGSGASPPSINTAEIGTQVIESGECYIVGFGVRETSGTAKADFGLWNGAFELVPIVVQSGQSATAYFSDSGIYVRNQLVVRVNSGVFSGSVYLRYPFC